MLYSTGASARACHRFDGLAKREKRRAVIQKPHPYPEVEVDEL
jgi:hypothetical protein